MRRFSLLSAVVPLTLAGAANADLVAHWDFDGDVDDQVGTADGAASNVNFVSSGAGPNGTGLGQAGAFNGSTSGVSFGSGSHPAVFDRGNAAFTFTGWFVAPTNFHGSTDVGVPNSSNNNRPLFGSMDTASAGGWTLDIGRADRSYRGKLFLTVGGGPAINVFSDARVDNSEWHWMAIVVDAGVASMFIDGVKQSTTATFSGTNTTTAPATVETGFGINSPQVPFEGQMDEFRLYNTALTATLDANGQLTGGELFEVWQVPEPASVGLLAIGAAACVRRRPR